MKHDIFTDEPIIKADPMALAADVTMLDRMCSGGNRNGLSGTADKRPPVYRPGSMDHEEIPSRMGNRLVYRDGRTGTV